MGKKIESNKGLKAKTPTAAKSHHTKSNSKIVSPKQRVLGKKPPSPLGSSSSEEESSADESARHKAPQSPVETSSSSSDASSVESSEGELPAKNVVDGRNAPSSPADSSSEDESPVKKASAPAKLGSGVTHNSKSDDDESSTESSPSSLLKNSSQRPLNGKAHGQPSPLTDSVSKPTILTSADSDSDSSSTGNDTEIDDTDALRNGTSDSSKKRKAEVDAGVPTKKAKSNEQSTSTTLWIGNLSWNVDDDWLKSEFESYGEVLSARVQVDRTSGRSRGFGYVEFADATVAQKAVSDVSKQIDGRPIRMDLAPARSLDQSKRVVAFNDKISDPSPILFVGNLAFNSTEDGVWESFGEFGEVKSVRLPTDRETGSLKGFGYVEFVNQADATKAIEGLQGKELFGRAVRLDYSHPKDPSAAGGRGGVGRGTRGGGGGRGNRGGGRGGPDRGRGGRGAPRGRGQTAAFQGKKITF